MERERILESWKEIASYLKRNIRTCQMWERQHGLPVHRLDDSPRAHVFAYADELDTWLNRKLHEAERGSLFPDNGEQRARPASRPRWRRRLGTVFLVVSVAGVSLLVHAYLTRTRSVPGRDPREPGSWKNSIAVLPFEDLSPDASLGYRCETLANDVATKLAATGELKVSSRLSTRRFARRESNPAQIMRDLNVATFLEGAMQSRGDLIQVDMSLVRTEDGARLWSWSYSRSPIDWLKLEDEIFKDVAARLGVRLTQEDRERSARRDPKSNKDYELFLLGRYFENRYSLGDEEEDCRRAVENLTSYIAANPDFAPAYCSLGNVHEHRFAVSGDPDDENSMRLCYEKAYALDPGLEETNLGMGWAHFYRRDFDRAYEYFRSAVALNPANPEVNWNVGSFFQSIGLGEKAILYFQKALVSDPLDSMLYWLSSLYCLHEGDYEKGLNFAEKAIALNPEYAPYTIGSARFLVLLKRPGEALRKLEPLPEEIKDRLTIRPLWAFVFAANGDREKALSLLLETQRLDRARRVICRIDVAGTYALLGMRDAALQTIKEGIKTGFEAVKMELYGYRFLGSYPYFKNLRDTPEFKAIVNQQKEIYDSRMKKYRDL